MGVFGLGAVVNTGHLRFIVIDGSTVQVPGASGTSYRLHVALDLVRLELRQVEVSTAKVGESLDHYALQEGDVVLLDRGYNQPKGLVPFVDQGGEVVLRYNPQGMNLYSPADQPLEKIDWPQRLGQLQGQAGTIPVFPVPWPPADRWDGACAASTARQSGRSAPQSPATGA